MISIGNSRQRCSLEHNYGALFFSLVDYQNNLFTSNNPDKVIEFYNSFESRDQLIQWMKERPKGVSHIHEVEGNKDIIVVIPTADYEGKYARNCRDNIFKGIHMIFVESGENPDPYFNYSHNCNVGIRKALEYNPKWVVVSNDDMNKIDDISILVNALSNLDNKNLTMVLTNSASYHSIPVKFAEPRKIFYAFMKIRGKQYRVKLTLWNKFKIKFFLPSRGILWDIFYKKGVDCYSIASFGIFSTEFLKLFIEDEGNLFDERFINATEDIDLSLKLTIGRADYDFVNYNIDNYKNGTLGGTFSKELRDIAGDVLLNYLISNSNDTLHKALRDRISKQ